MWTDSWTRRLPLRPGTLEDHLIWGVLACPDGVVTADVDGRVTHWSHSGEPTVLGSHDGPVRRLARDELGRSPVWATGGDDGTIRTWDPLARRALSVLRGHDAEIDFIVVGVHKGRTLLLSGSRDHSAIVWDLSAEQPARILRGHDGGVHCGQFLSVGGHDLAVTGGEDGTVRLWRIDDGTAIATLYGHTAPVGALAVRGSILLTGDDDGGLISWDLTRHRPRFRIRAHDSWVHSIALHRIGTTVLAATTGDRLVRVWNAETGAAMHRLEGHTEPTRKVRFARLGEREVLLSSAEDRSVRMWDPANGSEVDTLVLGGAAALFDVTADGRLAADHGPHLSVFDPGARLSRPDSLTDTEQEARAT